MAIYDIPVEWSNSYLIQGWIPIVSLGHAILLSYNLRKQIGEGPNHECTISPLQAIITVWILGVGGSVSTAILFGLNAKFFSGEGGLFTYTLVALLVLYVNPVYKAITAGRHFVLPIAAILDGFGRAGAILYGVKGVAASGLYLPALLAGTIAGSGGGLLSELFQITVKPYSWSLKVPRTIASRNPFRENRSFALAFIASLWYLLALRLLPLLPIQSGTDSIWSFLPGSQETPLPEIWIDIANLTVYWLCAFSCLFALDAHLYADFGNFILRKSSKTTKKSKNDDEISNNNNNNNNNNKMKSPKQPLRKTTSTSSLRQRTGNNRKNYKDEDSD